MAEQFASFTFEDENWQKFIKKMSAKISIVAKPNSKEAKQFEELSAVVVYKDISDHFEKETGPGGSWDSWSDAYAAHAAKSGRKRKLQWSGDLRKGILPAGGKEANPRRWLSSGILFYNKAKTKDGFAYAKHHDEGRSSHKGNPRKFMWLSSNGLKNLVSQAVKWLAEF